jgi:hypothetical protein
MAVAGRRERRRSVAEELGIALGSLFSRAGERFFSFSFLTERGV